MAEDFHHRPEPLLNGWSASVLLLSLLLPLTPVNSNSAGVSNPITWVGSASFDWFTPANWDQNRVPTRDDIVSVPYGLIEVNTNAQFAELDLRLGNLWGQLHVDTIMNVYGADVSGSLSISSNGVVNVRGDSVFKGTASNAGNVVVWPEARHRWYSGDATWYNLPAGVLEFRGSSGINSGGLATLVNFGTIRKTQASMFPMGVLVVNNGLLQVEAGTLELSAGMISSGTLEILPAAAVVLRGGTYNFHQEHRVTGPGAFVIAGNVGFQGELHDRLEWTNGIISGSLTIASNGVLDVTHHWYKILARGTTVTNHGSVNLDMDGFYWYWDGDVVWHNSRSGTLTALNSGEMAGSGIVVNKGTMRSAGVTLRVQHFLINHGLVEVNAGGWELVGGLLSDGRFYIGPDTSFSLREGTATFRETHTVTGSGLFGTYDYANLHIQDWIYSRFDWRGGTVHGNISVHSNAVLNLVGGQFSRPPTLGQFATLTNEGTIKVFAAENGEWYWGEHAVLHNTVSGLVEIGNVGSLGREDTLFRNDGTVLTTRSAPTSVFSQFVNAGRFELREGAPRFISTIVQISGETILKGGDLDADLHLLGGILKGSGIILGSVTNGSEIELRSDLGAITIARHHFLNSADYVQLPGGLLSVRFAEPLGSAGALLNVEATATLAGHLAISVETGTQPTPGTIIPVVSFENSAGNFQTFSGLGIRPGLRFDILHRLSDVSLRAAVPQNRFVLPGRRQNTFSVQFDGDPETLYELQASSDLENWQSLFTTNSQTGIIDFSDPDSANFLKRFYRVQQLAP